MRTLFFLILISACGNNTVLKNNKLENATTLSGPQASYLKTGSITKANPSRVNYQGKVYVVSIYSSKSSQDFINSMMSGTTLPITFTGGVSGDQIVLESIQRQ